MDDTELFIIQCFGSMVFYISIISRTENILHFTLYMIICYMIFNFLAHLAVWRCVTVADLIRIWIAIS